MPVPERGMVSYLYVEPKDAARAKACIERAIAGNGVTIEECQARIGNTFPDSMGGKGKTFTFLCSSDDTAFRLGAQELMALKSEEGILAGMFRDNRATVQNARSDGMSPGKK